MTDAAGVATGMRREAETASQILRDQAARDASITRRSAEKTRDDLVRADVIFAATGVTTGSLLAGIKREPGWVTLETILMRSKTGSVRRMTYKSPVR